MTKLDLTLYIAAVGLGLFVCFLLGLLGWVLFLNVLALTDPNDKSTKPAKKPGRLKAFWSDYLKSRPRWMNWAWLCLALVFFGCKLLGY